MTPKPWFAALQAKYISYGEPNEPVKQYAFLLEASVPSRLMLFCERSQGQTTFGNAVCHILKKL